MRIHNFIHKTTNGRAGIRLRNFTNSIRKITEAISPSEFRTLAISRTATR